MRREKWLGQNGKFAAGTLPLMLIAALLMVALPAKGQFPSYHIDFDVYWTGARYFLDGGYLYGAIPTLHQGAHLPFTYPPVAVLVFIPFALLPYQASSVLFTLLSLVALYVVARYTLNALRTYGFAVTEKPWHEIVLWGVIIASLFTAPIGDTFGFGQINLLLMALIVLDCLTPQRRWWTGALVGLTIAIKLTPMVFLLYFFWRRDWKSMGMTVGSLVAYNLIAFLVMPSTAKLYWTEIITNGERIGNYDYAGNQSINGLLARFGLEDTTLSVAWLIVALIAGLAVAVIVWQLVKTRQHFAALMVNGLAANLCSPVSWEHHWTWAIPLVALFAVWACKQTPARWVWGVLSGLGIIIFYANPYAHLPSDQHRELAWSPWQHIVGESYVLWTLLVLIALLALRPFSRASEMRDAVVKVTALKKPVPERD